jgi:hypothetical protein
MLQAPPGNGKSLREENRHNVEHIKRQLTFLTCALDGLLTEHPDMTLRSRVHDAYRRKVTQADPEHGK